MPLASWNDLDNNNNVSVHHCLKYKGLYFTIVTLFKIKTYLNFNKGFYWNADLLVYKNWKIIYENLHMYTFFFFNKM
jgi:hypothetical protein